MTAVQPQGLSRMTNVTLIIGESGTGKSTSIRTLDPNETFIINILDKPLPFKAYRNNYVQVRKKGSEGNYHSTDDCEEILRLIRRVNDDRPDIKNLIIDDYQYLLANEFMRRAKESGFGKFTEIGRNGWLVIRELTLCRPDLYSFVLSHSDADEHGKVRCKTIGKLLSDKISLEGMFTCVLHTQVIDGKYKFLTQNTGIHLAKSPMDMFEEELIDNDLAYVKSKMVAYAGED